MSMFVPDGDATASPERPGSQPGTWSAEWWSVYEVVAVGGAVDPFDRAGEVDAVGDGGAVGSDEVDLGVVLSVPPAAYCGGVGPGEFAGLSGEFRCFADEWFDGASAPAGPLALGHACADVGASTAGLFLDGASDGQVGAQVAVGDPVERRFAGLGGERVVHRQDPLLLGQPPQKRR